MGRDEHRPSAWRDPLRLRYAQINAIASVILLAPTLLGFEFEHYGPMLVVFTLVVVALVWLVFRTRVAPRHLATISICTTLLCGTLALAHGGWLPGAILILTVSPLVASVVQGRVFALVTALLGGCALLSVGYAMSHGLLSGPPGQSIMGDWALWLRISVVCTICWLVFALLANLGVEVIERSITEQLETRAKLDSERRVRAEVEQSRDEAKAAFVEAQRQETIAALAGGLAHDFNNTLMVIMSWAELLLEAEDEPELQVEARASILTSAQQASSLARQLLSLGRKDVGTPEPVDIAGVLALSVAGLRKLVPGDVQVRLESKPVPPVLAEPAQLQQVILNLAINARDAMPEGGELRFEVLERRDRAGTCWSGFAVHDSGTGMDPDTQAKIFKPFFTTKAEGRGTGLGLASVLAIVNQLGGQLELDSVQGAGTTFTIWLPARPDLRRNQGTAASLPEGRLHGLALVVENEPQVCTFVARTLEGLGLEVTEALDGDAALALIETCDHLDLLCTDGVMPGAKAADFIERALERFPACEVLVCSGHLPDDLIRRQIAVGRYAFLPKPFAASDLRAHAHSLLGAAKDAVA